VIERQDAVGRSAYRVWLPAKDAVVRARARTGAAGQRAADVEQILHTTAAAKLLDALEDNLLLAPIQSSVVPLPHQLYALNRAISRDRIRYLLADEVGLGKTIEAGLVLRELKLRGRVKRILVVAPKGAGAPMAGGNASALRREVPVHRAFRAGGLPPMAQRRRARKTTCGACTTR
jgi:hypothetical protein